MAEDLRARLAPLVEEGLPFLQRTGIRLLHAEAGRVRLAAPAEPNVNHIGTMYAGALFTLAEVPGGVLSLATFDAERYYPIIKGMEIRFTALARGEITADVTMAPEEVARIAEEAAVHGKADFDLDAELVDADGTVVCRAVGHYQLRRHGT